MNPKTFFITGVSTGLGKAIAVEALNAGHRVIGTVRNAQAAAGFEALKPGHAHAFLLDVTDTAAVNATLADVATTIAPVDVLINNAGYGHEGIIEESPLEELRRQFEVNVFGAVAVIKAVLPSMRARRTGHIINVTSESVILPFPYMLVYAATKAGLERFSEGLEREVEPEGIRVTRIRAGQMADEDSEPLAISPEVGRRFVEAAARNGLHLRERAITPYASVTDVFVAVVNMPADIHLPLVTVAGRYPNAGLPPAAG